MQVTISSFGDGTTVEIRQQCVALPLTPIGTQAYTSRAFEIQAEKKIQRLYMSTDVIVSAVCGAVVASIGAFVAFKCRSSSCGERVCRCICGKPEDRIEAHELKEIVSKSPPEIKNN